MTRTVTIDPVTRIEGHAKVLIQLGDDGQVSSAGLVVNELRGFERILVGMEADRMPLITSRICGVCPTAHHLAAVKALDALAGVEPPPAGKLLRELMLLGHFIHSHALSLFVLQGPDLIMGIDADPQMRNVGGVVAQHPEVAKKAITLRTLGQKINEMIGGRGVNPVTAVAGGCAFQLDDEKRATLIAWIDQAMSLVNELGGIVKTLLDNLLAKQPSLLSELTLPTWSMATVQDGKVNFYDGLLRVMDADGRIRAEYEVTSYRDFLVESTLKWSYMKPVHFQLDDAMHLYRVNTLARINCTETMETRLADQALQAFRQTFGRPCHHTVMLIYARWLELIYAVEKAKVVITDPAIMGENRVPVQLNKGGQGVGHVEAPRGTLIHDYEVDDKGIVRRANLIVATQQNYSAINFTLKQAAQAYLKTNGNFDDQAILNGLEFAIRCYDPCLSCATHALGQMPLEVVIERGGNVTHRLRRT
jgi:F420-non-reducing hydrogenase large subunit